ncbi:hypothetical protein CAEBREN_32745 [Caenorhabditis brenneri]|uniref:Uncharacterized protein n=1 Tax=Caenorhabditis brenneri TaxID=135651 RepID=G0P3I5_CAEBE|nr:hypothetical protein CAEBREN_32745 [Caenorhabditis brenneri]
MARKAMPASPSMSSPQITKLRVNGRVVRVTAIRQSAYYSSSEDEDSVNGGTLGKKDSTLTRPPQTAPRTASLLSNKKKETTSDANNTTTTVAQHQPPPPPIAKNTAERRSGTRKERAVEDMLRLVQENRDRHDQQKKDYGEYVQARIRPKAPGGEVIRVSRQDYRNSKIIVTDGEAIRISPHREEIETTIEESTSLNGHHRHHFGLDDDDEAVYVNTAIGGGGGARVPSPNETAGQDYANAVLQMSTEHPSRVYFPSMALRKTRYLRQTVSSTSSSIFNPNRKLSSENHKEYLAQLHSRKAVSLKEKKVKQQRSAEEGYASSSPSTSASALIPSRPPIPKYHHVCEPSYGDEDELDDGATITSSVDFIPGFGATRNEEQLRKHRNFVVAHSAPSTSSTESSCQSFRWSFVRSESKDRAGKFDEDDEMAIGWVRRRQKGAFKKWKLNSTIHDLVCFILGG